MLEAWVLAVRPRTLPAGAVPVVLGSALAAEAGSFVLLPALVALCCALGIQVATNFINEIYDFRKGADTAERLGPTRTVAAGLISENTMVRAAALLLGAVFLLGLYLVFIGGWPILLIGMLSILFAWAYTGGPRPIAYSGLVIFSFLCFSGWLPSGEPISFRLRRLNQGYFLPLLFRGLFPSTSFSATISATLPPTVKSAR